jgi:predicted anti-sigma-YlaC factor YlaD
MKIARWLLVLTALLLVVFCVVNGTPVDNGKLISSYYV